MGGGDNTHAGRRTWDLLVSPIPDVRLLLELAHPLLVVHDFHLKRFFPRENSIADFALDAAG